MQRVVQTGTATAAADLAHSVHVEVDRDSSRRAGTGTASTLGDEVSRVAAPAPRPPARRAARAPPLRLRVLPALGVQATTRPTATCWPTTSTCVVHLGDYIYETSAKARDRVRRHELAGGHRSRGLSAPLRALQDRCRPAGRACRPIPWIVTWDDHEVANDYANDRSAASRRSAGLPAAARGRLPGVLRAHAPAARTLPHGPEHAALSRPRLGHARATSSCSTAGSIAPCSPAARDGRGGGPARGGLRGPRLDPAQTRLGALQEQWLFDGLGRVQSRWTIVAQQTAHGPAAPAQPGRSGSLLDRRLGRLCGRAPAHPRAAPRSASAQPGGDRRRHPLLLGDGPQGGLHGVGARGGDPSSSARRSARPGIPYDRVARLLPDNPHVRFFDSRPRGYVRCTVTAERWLTELRALESAADPRSAIGALASFVVESGRPGAQRV